MFYKKDEGVTYFQRWLVGWMYLFFGLLSILTFGVVKLRFFPLEIISKFLQKKYKKEFKERQANKIKGGR